jgi:hypothetical protein
MKKEIKFLIFIGNDFDGINNTNKLCRKLYYLILMQFTFSISDACHFIIFLFALSFCNSYHLSETKLNGLAPNFDFSITKTNEFFITKFNCSSPNSIHFLQIIQYLNHQIYWSVTKNNWIRQSLSLVNSTYFYHNSVTKTKNMFQVTSTFINLLFLKVKSQYKNSKNY